MSKTKFLYDDSNKPIGRVDEDGNIYTMSLTPSHPYYHTPAGVAVNKSHIARAEAANSVTFEPEFDPTLIFKD